MTRSRLIALTFVAILGMGVIIYLCLPKEPHYQGRTLSQWLYQAPASFKDSGGRGVYDPQWQSASNAVQKIGTNALPLLLKWVSAKDSKQRAAIISWINSHRFLHCHFHTATERQEAACYGFLLLKDKARPACPFLVQFTRDEAPEVRNVGFLCLLLTKADRNTVLPAYLRLSKDSDRNVQFTTAYWYHYYYPEDAEASGVYQVNPLLRNQPTILTDTNRPLLR